MAKVINAPAQNKPVTVAQETKQQNKSNTKYTIIGIFSAIGIILLVCGIVFTIVMKSNTGGIADKYRANIQGIPVLKYALPKAADPDDPKNLTQSELTDKYNALRKEKLDYQKREQDLNSQIAELTKYKAAEEKRTADAQSAKDAAEALKKQADDATVKLEADKKAFDTAVANADKQAFRTYYESVNKDTAQKIYTEIITQQKISDDIKKYVQIYEQMDSKAAAKIFEQMGSNQTDLVVEILKNMSKDKVAKILPEMSTSFAAKISQKLSEVYMKN
jgi:Uncharacterized conserved protein